MCSLRGVEGSMRKLGSLLVSPRDAAGLISAKALSRAGSELGGCCLFESRDFLYASINMAIFIEADMSDTYLVGGGSSELTQS
jgi:hypothetical protein